MTADMSPTPPAPVVVVVSANDDTDEDSSCSLTREPCRRPPETTSTISDEQTTTSTVQLQCLEPPLSSSSADAQIVEEEGFDQHLIVCSSGSASNDDAETSKASSSTPITLQTSHSATSKVTHGDRCVGRVRLGICAMDKKARSKPMVEILSRLDEDLFCVVFFGDDTILNQPIEEWPECHFLVAFFSKGFPLQKAKEYVTLRRPFLLNELDMQGTLQDRRRVYDLLEASGIDTPKHVFLSRDGYVSTGTGDGNRANDQVLQEFDDHIEVNGVTVHKPFVEKPVNAEDHNIAIYYPTSKFMADGIVCSSCKMLLPRFSC